MSKETKKQPAKKRVYIKRSAKWDNNDNPVTFKRTDFEGPVIPAPKADSEIQDLTAIISIFDNWTEDQRIRNIRFLASKYWEYLKDSTII